MKVSNRKCIRHLAGKSLLSNRARNLVAIAAIALTAVLFTSLFTIALSINEGFQQSNFRQAGGFSHGGFKYITETQAEALRSDPLIAQWGERRFLGMPAAAPFNKSHVEVSYADANEAHWMYCDPIEGALPEEGTDQAATDTPRAGAAGHRAGDRREIYPYLRCGRARDHPELHPLRLVGVRRSHRSQPHPGPPRAGWTPSSPRWA